MKLQLRIKEVSNGFILEWKEDWSEEDDKVIKQEYEVIEETVSEKETMTRLLHRVAIYFGIDDDRYGNENLRISWDKEGRKYESKDD